MHKDNLQPVPYVSLDAQWAVERNALLPIIENVLASGAYVSGEDVGLLEEELSAFHGGQHHVVALNSGTDALVCGLIALGVGRGDEVITPANSFIASTAAIVHLGATPIFADICRDQTICPESVERCLSSRTKAIMPVHLTGRMAQMDRIEKIAQGSGVAIIEDSAQSIGSKYCDRLSGTIGEIGCFSAHPLKNLNACGDAGFLLTKNENISERIRSIRSHGMRARNSVDEFGYVSRMDSLQAAILRYRLKELPKIIERRREHAALYSQNLDKEYVFFPDDGSCYFSTYHTFVVQVEERDSLVEHLKDLRIGTAIHYPVPIHLQPAYIRRFGSLPPGSLAETERQAGRILSLPVNHSLTTEQILTVCSAINQFYRGRK